MKAPRAIICSIGMSIWAASPAPAQQQDEKLGENALQIRSKPTPARDVREIVDQMNRVGAFTSEQTAYIQSLLQDQNNAISLFANHGLLSGEALQVKVREISDITLARIQGLLSAEQKILWNQGGARPERRRIILPKPAE